MSSQVSFIYRVSIHNKTYLMTLIINGISTPHCILFNTLIYRDPTIPPSSNNMVRVSRTKCLFVVSIVELTLKRVKDLPTTINGWIYNENTFL